MIATFIRINQNNWRVGSSTAFTRYQIKLSANTKLEILNICTFHVFIVILRRININPIDRETYRIRGYRPSGFLWCR